MAVNALSCETVECGEGSVRSAKAISTRLDLKPVVTLPVAEARTRQKPPYGRTPHMAEVPTWQKPARSKGTANRCGSPYVAEARTQ